MTAPSKPSRIAIVVPGQGSFCREVVLPFSLEGYPPVDIVLYGAGAGHPTGSPVLRLADLLPEQFDLILDGHFLT
ncbi:MAG: hypothetical protein WCD80_14765, partial [Desulfobaccales bacterium]